MAFVWQPTPQHIQTAHIQPLTMHCLDCVSRHRRCRLLIQRMSSHVSVGGHKSLLLSPCLHPWLSSSLLSPPFNLHISPSNTQRLITSAFRNTSFRAECMEFTIFQSFDILRGLHTVRLKLLCKLTVKQMLIKPKSVCIFNSGNLRSW